MSAFPIEPCIRQLSPDALAVVNTMTPATKTGADDHDRLIDLAHLSSAVGALLDQRLQRHGEQLGADSLADESRD